LGGSLIPQSCFGFLRVGSCRLEPVAESSFDGSSLKWRGGDEDGIVSWGFLLEPFGLPSGFPLLFSVMCLPFFIVRACRHSLETYGNQGVVCNMTGTTSSAAIRPFAAQAYVARSDAA
jgi:hypothetical protein